MLMNDIETVAAEIARVLTPGGVFAAGIGGGPQPGGGLELFLAIDLGGPPEEFFEHGLNTYYGMASARAGGDPKRFPRRVPGRCR